MNGDDDGLPPPILERQDYNTEQADADEGAPVLESDVQERATPQENGYGEDIPVLAPNLPRAPPRVNGFTDHGSSDNEASVSSEADSNSSGDEENTNEGNEDIASDPDDELIDVETIGPDEDTQFTDDDSNKENEFEFEVVSSGVEFTQLGAPDRLSPEYDPGQDERDAEPDDGELTNDDDDSVADEDESGQKDDDTVQEDEENEQDEDEIFDIIRAAEAFALDDSFRLRNEKHEPLCDDGYDVNLDYDGKSAHEEDSEDPFSCLVVERNFHALEPHPLDRPILSPIPDHCRPSTSRAEGEEDSANIEPAGREAGIRQRCPDLDITHQHLDSIHRECLVPEFICVICQQICNNSIRNKCSHRFCSSCMEDFLNAKNHRCPICNDLIMGLIRDWKFDRIIESFGMDKEKVYDTSGYAPFMQFCNQEGLKRSTIDRTQGLFRIIVPPTQYDFGKRPLDEYFTVQNYYRPYNRLIQRYLTSRGLPNDPVDNNHYDMVAFAHGLPFLNPAVVRGVGLEYIIAASQSDNKPEVVLDQPVSTLPSGRHRPIKYRVVQKRSYDPDNAVEMNSEDEDILRGAQPDSEDYLEARRRRLKKRRDPKPDEEQANEDSSSDDYSSSDEESVDNGFSLEDFIRNPPHPSSILPAVNDSDKGIGEGVDARPEVVSLTKSQSSEETASSRESSTTSDSDDEVVMDKIQIKRQLEQYLKDNEGRLMVDSDSDEDMTDSSGDDAETTYDIEMQEESPSRSRHEEFEPLRLDQLVCCPPTLQPAEIPPPLLRKSTRKRKLRKLSSSSNSSVGSSAPVLQRSDYAIENNISSSPSQSGSSSPENLNGQYPIEEATLSTTFSPMSMQYALQNFNERANTLDGPYRIEQPMDLEDDQTMDSDAGHPYETDVGLLMDMGAYQPLQLLVGEPTEPEAWQQTEPVGSNVTEDGDIVAHATEEEWNQIMNEASSRLMKFGKKYGGATRIRPFSTNPLQRPFFLFLPDEATIGHLVTHIREHYETKYGGCTVRVLMYAVLWTTSAEQVSLAKMGEEQDDRNTNYLDDLLNRHKAYLRRRAARNRVQSPPSSVISEDGRIKEIKEQEPEDDGEDRKNVEEHQQSRDKCLKGRQQLQRDQQQSQGDEDGREEDEQEKEGTPPGAAAGTTATVFAVENPMEELEEEAPLYEVRADLGLRQWQILDLTYMLEVEYANDSPCTARSSGSSSPS